MRGFNDSDANESEVVKDKGKRPSATSVRESVSKQTKSRGKRMLGVDSHIDDDIIIELPVGVKSAFKSVETTREMGHATLLPEDKEKVLRMLLMALLDSLL